MQPIHAPMTGISAVTAINTLIKSTYGMPKTVIAKKNNPPKITASRHCPVINEENVRCVSCATRSTSFTSPGFK